MFVIVIDSGTLSQSFVLLLFSPPKTLLGASDAMLPAEAPGGS